MGIMKQKVPRTAKLYVPYFLSLPLVIARCDLLAIMASSSEMRSP